MSKLRGILLGVALALPFAAVGASGDVAVTAKTETMTSVQSGPQGRCCFVWYMGNWWCIPC